MVIARWCSHKQDAIRISWSAPYHLQLDNVRFYAKIERVTGQWRKARPRGRPRLESDVVGEAIEGQG
ncbi:MAG: hypothetical protein ACREWG_03795, partial [Gammaproteobacteria bacterium]